MPVDTLEAILRFERFLNTDLSAPRYDHHMSLEEASAMRTADRVKDENIIRRALNGARVIGTITYYDDKKEITYSRENLNKP